MAKDYNEISNQAAVVKVDGRTLAFYPNLEVPDVNKYGEGIQGKVKVTINDYSEGKGDNAKFCSFNLELKTVFYLFEKAKMSHLPASMFLTKLVGSEVLKDGPFEGLSPSSHMRITRTATTSSGQLMRMPWKITITNGFAKAMPGKQKGTFYEAKDSFKVTKESDMSLTDEDFLDVFTKITNYIKKFDEFMCTSVFQQGLTAYLKAEEARSTRNTYSKNIATATPQTKPASAPTPKEEPKQMTMADMAPAQSTAQAQASAPQTHKMTMVISSPFQYLNGNTAVAQCMIGGASYVVNFPEVDDALVEAQEKQLAISCLLYADKNKQMHFYSMAS